MRLIVRKTFLLRDRPNGGTFGCPTFLTCDCFKWTLVMDKSDIQQRVAELRVEIAALQSRSDAFLLRDYNSLTANEIQNKRRARMHAIRDELLALMRQLPR